MTTIKMITLKKNQVILINYSKKIQDKLLAISETVVGLEFKLERELNLKKLNKNLNISEREAAAHNDLNIFTYKTILGKYNWIGAGGAGPAAAPTPLVKLRPLVA